MNLNKDLEFLTDQELNAKAKELNVKICPITTTTRKIVIKKLKKALEIKYLQNEDKILPKPDFDIVDIENDIENNIENIEFKMTKLSLQSTPNRNLQNNTNFYTVYYLNEAKIVNSLKDVSEIAKINPNLRFKKFTSFDGASSFMESFYDSLLNDTSDSKSELKNSNKVQINDGIPIFKSWFTISSKLIAKYRYYVEKGNIQKVNV